MSRSSVFAAALMGAVACAWSGCAQIFGIDAANEVPEPSDGAQNDMTQGEASGDDVRTGDGPAADADAGHDGDATNLTDGPPLGDVNQGDGCAAVLARMLSAPISAPNQWAGIDFSNGGASNDVPGSGGITFTQAGVASCAGWMEPSVIANAQGPNNPGYRMALFGLLDAGPDAAYPLTLYANMQSGAIYQALASDGYKGTVSFHSRSGGAYGSHTYEIGVGTTTLDGGPVGAGAGFVHRDGVDFPADWTTPIGDAGKHLASPWMNELYDGMMATFSPATPAIGDCMTTPYVGYNNGDGLATHHSGSCLALPNIGNGIAAFGARPIALYFYFNVGTNQTSLMYGEWLGGVATCSTPVAATERMDWGSISYESMGDLVQSEYVSTQAGLTFTEANAVECNGTPTTAPDPGYGGITWGQSGELTMEYNLDSGVNYKLFAQSGYKGSLNFADATGATLYTVAVDTPITANGSAVAMNWANDAVATTLSNAFCGAADTDCAAAADCTFVANDGSGHSYLGFPCGAGFDAVGIQFPQGSSTPSRIITVNPLGQ
ncbi:MAG TPA: hypothetical protein VMI75_22665 [Polyangiaceae bacterium]|nr:hypothetical protein [Polyangiaceae bacterium]